MGESLRRVRVAVILENDQKQVLLCRQNNKPFWVLPGGTLEPNETLLECAVRELKEEVDLDISVGDLVGISEFFPENRPSVVDFFVIGQLLGGTLKMTEDENLNDVGWFSLNEIEKMDLKPQSALQLVSSILDGKSLESLLYLKG